MFEHIMVPYDNSEHAVKAFGYALDLAVKYSSKMSIVQHVPINFAKPGDGTSYPETTSLLKKSAALSLSKLEPRLKELGIPYELAVIEGVSVIETLTSYAEMHHVSLIVMGSRGLGGFKKLLVGSVATGVSQHARCPVLIVK